MSRSLALAIVVYGLGLALLCVVAAARDRATGPAITLGLVVLEVALILQAVIDLVAVARGEHGPNLATHLGYLIASVALLPAAAAAMRGDPQAEDREDTASNRWAEAGLGVGALVVAVVTIRLHQTLGQRSG